MLIPNGTVIALVDGENFELLRNSGTAAEPDLTSMPVPKLDSSNHSGTSHSSSSGNHEGSLVSEDAHAGAASAWLNEQVLGHKIENLIVIAAPRTLGEMRPHYHKQTEQVLIGDLAKSLIGKQPAEVLAALRDAQ